jgi:hypothetical protein
VRRQQFHCQRRRVAHVNFAELPAGDSFDCLYRFIHPLHCRAGFHEKNAAGFSEPDGFRAVVDKRDAEFIFEVTNLPAQRRLRNVKPRCCTRDAFFFGDTLLTPTDVWNAKIYSDGWKKPGLGTADVTEKATGAKLGEVGIASAEDISAAAAMARQAQKDWAKLPGPKRGDVLREFSRLLLEHSEEIANQLVRETGSIRAKAQWEVLITAREFMEAAALGSQPHGILTADLEAGRQSVARRIPLGVIGIITPWNSPFILGARAIGPALAMGNAVILKPDVQTPVAGGVTFARLLEKAGLPNGLFHVLPGGPETGAALVKKPLVNMISFTGSTRVGRQVGSVASGELKRLLWEKTAQRTNSGGALNGSELHPAEAG